MALKLRVNKQIREEEHDMGSKFAQGPFAHAICTIFARVFAFPKTQLIELHKFAHQRQRCLYLLHSSDVTRFVEASLTLTLSFGAAKCNSKTLVPSIHVID